MKGKLGSKRGTKGIKLRYTFLLISILMFSVTFLSDTIRASSFNYPGLMDNRFDVVDGLDTYTPDLNAYPFDEPGVKSAALTELWGSSKGLTKYLGEVPSSLANEGEGELLRTSNSNRIGGLKRPWSSDSGLKESDIVPTSSDLHIKAMAEASGSGAGTMGWILYHIVNVINFLVGALLSLLLKLKDINMDMILDTLNAGGALRDTLNTLFLISPDGEMSPFLMIMLTVYVFSLIGVIYKALKGDMAVQLAMREFGFLILAALIAGVALSSGSQLAVAKWGVNLATSLSNDIVASSTKDSELFKYDTGDTTKDGNMTQMALLEKPHVDNFIAMQFGVSVSDLQIKNKNGNYTNHFGKDTAKAVDETFGEKGSFVVNAGSGPVHNLGYFWWAANSNVGTNKPINDNGTVKNASNMRYLFIIDFLNNARAHAEANGETEVVSKIDKIMTKMWHPDWMSGSLTLLMLTALKVALLYAFYLIIVFMSVGKIIITVGAFAVPLLAGLTLAGKTRPMAKKLMGTYFMGFARYIIGLIMINIIISTVSSLSSQGTGGILIAIILAAMIGKFVPTILLELNRHIAVNDAPFMSGMNRGFSRYANGVKSNRDKGSKSSIEYDKDGNLVNKDRSLSGKIASGLNGGKGSGGGDAGDESVDENKVKTNKMSDSNKTDKINADDDNSSDSNTENPEFGRGTGNKDSDSENKDGSSSSNQDDKTNAGSTMTEEEKELERKRTEARAKETEGGEVENEDEKISKDTVENEETESTESIESTDNSDSSETDSDTEDKNESADPKVDKTTIIINNSKSTDLPVREKREIDPSTGFHTDMNKKIDDVSKDEDTGNNTAGNDSSESKDSSDTVNDDKQPKVIPVKKVPSNIKLNDISKSSKTVKIPKAPKVDATPGVAAPENTDEPTKNIKIPKVNEVKTPKEVSGVSTPRKPSASNGPVDTKIPIVPATTTSKDVSEVPKPAKEPKPKDIDRKIKEDKPERPARDKKEPRGSNSGKSSFMKRQAKNIGMRTMQKTVTGRKVAEKMQRDSNTAKSNNNNSNTDND